MRGDWPFSPFSYISAGKVKYGDGIVSGWAFAALPSHPAYSKPKTRGDWFGLLPCCEERLTLLETLAHRSCLLCGWVLTKMLVHHCDDSGERTSRRIIVTFSAALESGGPTIWVI